MKPQFEAGRTDVGKGVVRDPEVWQKTLRSVAEAAQEWGGETVGVVDSGLPGPKGNREFFLHLVKHALRHTPDDINRWIAEATEL